MKKINDIQILDTNQHIAVAGIIQSKIDILDSYTASKNASNSDTGDDAIEPTKDDVDLQMNIGAFFIDPQYTDYRKLASPNLICTFKSFLIAHQSDPAFQPFHEKLTKFLKWILPQCEVPVQRNFRLNLSEQVCLKFNNYVYA
jgi:hypothetical protein